MNHRRDILRLGARCGGLLALGGIASLLGWRATRGDCLKVNPCGGCPLFSGCDLPKARSVKTPSDRTTPDHG